MALSLTPHGHLVLSRRDEDPGDIFGLDMADEKPAGKKPGRRKKPLRASNAKERS